MTAFEIILTPTGHLMARSADGGSDRKASTVARAFGDGNASGLLKLAAMPLESPSPSTRFWREFAGDYLSTRCRHPSPPGVALETIPPPADLDDTVSRAPPGQGMEYLSIAWLAAQWAELDDTVRDAVSASGTGLATWVRSHAPSWHAVGRVCLHLAENTADDAHPFAFLATYAPDVSHTGRVRYRPLGKALEELAGARNRKALATLLEPVRQAAGQSRLMAELLDSGDLFHPLAWTADEAYRLLREAPDLESAGLLVRLPDWWRSRPRLQVAVNLGGKSAPRLSASSLDLDVSLAVGDEVLDQAEWQHLLDADAGLVLLNGRWIEVDGERLREALAHWRKVKREAGRDGLSFIEGMRLLAGAPRSLDAGDLPGSVRQWSSITPSSALGEMLRRLREPEAGPAAGRERLLQAELRPYQAVGRAWLRLLAELGLGGCLADDMGLGKTVQIIALLCDLHEGRRKRRPGTDDVRHAPSLLVIPASLLGNWQAELERFAPGLEVHVVHPCELTPDALSKLASAPERAFEGADLVITTYGMLLRQQWLIERDWHLAILDEAQAVKNPAARQTRAVKRIRAHARIALTGTPVENRLGDLWSLFDFLCPGLLGPAERFRRFVNALEARKEARYAPLRTLVQPYILRRLKTDRSVIQDLPDKLEMKTWCGLGHRQAALYKRTVADLRARLAGTGPGIERRGLVLVTLMRLKQICNHPDQVTAGDRFAAGESGKFTRLAEIVEEIASRQERLLVFTQFRELTGPLARFLGDCFEREGLILDGSTAVRRRKTLVDAFQADDGPPFMVLSLKAGGVGLNLTAASHVVHFDRWWNPAVEDQATDRAFRIGQTRNVVVHKFVCRGTVEERIDALMEDKMELARDLLQGGGEARLTEMADEELLEVLSLDIHRARA